MYIYQILVNVGLWPTVYCLLQTILHQCLLGWGMIQRLIGMVACRVDPQGFAEMNPLYRNTLRGRVSSEFLLTLICYVSRSVKCCTY